MKTFSFLILSACITAASGQAGWVTLNTGVTTNLRDIDYIGENNIYIIGSNYKLITSEDAGASFTTLPDALNKYPPLSVSNEESMFLSTSTGNIYHTNDSGNSWDSQYTGCFCLLTVIDFTDENHGITTGFGGSYRTEDGGNNWLFMEDLPVYGAEGVQSFSSGRIILINNFSIWLSNDHGAHFSEISTDTIGDYYFSDLSMLNPDVGFIITGNSMLFKTVNGALTWDYIDQVPLDNTLDIAFVDENFGFVLGGNLRDQIYMTTDGGNSWSLSIETPQTISEMITTPKYVYASGDAGLLLQYALPLNSTPSALPAGNKLFPNPATKQINLITSATGYDFCIVNAQGKVVYVDYISDYQIEIDVSDFAPGLYVVKSLDNNTLLESFIVQ